MKNWRNRIGTVLTAVGVVGAMGAGCGGAPSGPKNAEELEAKLRDTWLAIPKGDNLNRELFQLAFPTTNSVSVWHLYEKGANQRLSDEAFVIYKCTGDPTTEGQTCNSIVDGKKEGKYIRRGPTASAVAATAPFAPELPLAERIDFQNLDTGTFYRIAITASNGEQSSLVAQTKPENARDFTSFLALSCNNPYAITDGQKIAFGSHDWQKKMREKQNSLRLFADRANNVIKLKDYPRPAFALGLGDQVYVDGDNKMGNSSAIFTGDQSKPSFDGDAKLFRPLLDVVYRAHFAMPSYHKGLQGVPTAMIWDDHELQDGWEAKNDHGKLLNSLDEGYEDYPKAALETFLGYQSLRNPKPETIHEIKKSAMDVDFTWGTNIRVRMLDTRSIELPQTRQYADACSRDHKPESEYAAWDKQLADLKTWFNQAPADKTTLFVLGLASPLSIATGTGKGKTWFAKLAACGHFPGVSKPDQCDDLNDLWAAKKAARIELLQALTGHFLRHPKHRLLILSGDVHYSGINYLSTGTGSCFHLDKDHPCSCWTNGETKPRSDFSSHQQASVCKSYGYEATCANLTKKNDPGLCNDVLWGWEVISSGITNDALGVEDRTAFIKRGLLIQGTVDDAMENSLMSAWPRGAIYGSPSFAEILVKQTKDDEPFDVGVVFYPSDFNGQEVNLAEEFEQHGTPWDLEPYKSFEGSKKNATWQQACGDTQKLTRVPLEWNCVPDTDTGGTILSLVHACSVINTRKGEASEIADKDN